MSFLDIFNSKQPKNNLNKDYSKHAIELSNILFNSEEFKLLDTYLRNHDLNTLDSIDCNSAVVRAILAGPDAMSDSEILRRATDILYDIAEVAKDQVVNKSEGESTDSPSDPEMAKEDTDPDAATPDSLSSRLYGMLEESKEYRDLIQATGFAPSDDYLRPLIATIIADNPFYPDETRLNLLLNRLLGEIDVWAPARVDEDDSSNEAEEAEDNTSESSMDLNDGNSDEDAPATEDNSEEPNGNDDTNGQTEATDGVLDGASYYNTIKDILKAQFQYYLVYIGTVDNLEDVAEKIGREPRIGDIVGLRQKNDNLSFMMWNGTKYLDLGDEEPLFDTPFASLKIPVVMITGKGGCGKDSIISGLDSHIFAMNFSSIDPIKDALKTLGWDPEDKSDGARAILHDMKMISQKYNDYPNHYCLDRILDIRGKLQKYSMMEPSILEDDMSGLSQNQTQEFWFPVIFLQIREAESRDAFAKIFYDDERLDGNFELISCLVTRDVTDGHVYGNHCDDDAEKGTFDWVIDNDDLEKGINAMTVRILDYYLAERWGSGEYTDDMANPMADYGILRNQFIDGWKYHRVRFESYDNYMIGFVKQLDHFLDLQAHLKYNDKHPQPPMFPFGFEMGPGPEFEAPIEDAENRTEESIPEEDSNGEATE